MTEVDEIKQREECSVHACNILQDVNFALPEDETEAINQVSDLLFLKKAETASLRKDLEQLHSELDLAHKIIERKKTTISEYESTISRLTEKYEEVYEDNKKLESEVQFHCVGKESVIKQLDFEKENANTFAAKADEYRDIISKERAKSAKLLEALKFYGNEANWTTEAQVNLDEQFDTLMSAGRDEHGKTAREAISDYEKGGSENG